MIKYQQKQILSYGEIQGVIVMDLALKNEVNLEAADKELLGMLDRGIDDMESGRELPLEDAFEKVTELRNIRRDART